MAGAYQAAVSQFEVQWLALTALGALIVATDSPYWTLPEAAPRTLPWPTRAVMQTSFWPGWLLTTGAAAAKLLGVSPRLVIWVWCAGACWLLIGAWRASAEASVPSRGVAMRSIWVWGLVVVAVAALLRLWSIDAVPRDVHPDEAVTTFSAWTFYADPARDWFGASTIMNFFYALAGTGTLVFGRTLAGARASDVLFGTASVVLLFDALRRISTLRVAVVGALLLAVNHVHIAYSRSAAGYIQSAFVVTLLLAIAVRVWTRPTYFNAALLGVMAALGAQTVPASVLSLPLLVTLLLVLVLLHPSHRRALLVPLSVAAISCATIGAPFGVGNWQHRDELLVRSRQLSIFTPQKMSQLKHDVHHTDSAAAVLALQAWDGITGFHRGHDAQPQYGVLRPLADSYTAALMIAGVIFALLRFRQFLATSALIFTAGYLLFGLGMYYAPGFQRAVGALPFGMTLAAIGLVQCCETLCASRVRLTGWGRDLLLAAAVIVCGLANFHIYFVETRTTLLTGDANSEPGWVAMEFGRDYHVHFVDWFPPGPEGMRLITADLPVSYNKLRDPVAYAKTADVSGADLFIVHGEDTAARDALLERFPDARVEVRRRHPVYGPTLFLVFVTSPGASHATPESSANPGDGLIWKLARWAGLGKS